MTIAKILINAVINHPMRWLYWHDILEAHIPGFGNMSKIGAAGEMKRWRGRLSDTRRYLIEKKYFLMGKGQGNTRKLKLATNHPDDIAHGNAMIDRDKRLTAAQKEKQKKQLAILADTKKLPPYKTKPQLK